MTALAPGATATNAVVTKFRPQKPDDIVYHSGSSLWTDPKPFIQPTGLGDLDITVAVDFTVYLEQQQERISSAAFLRKMHLGSLAVRQWNCIKLSLLLHKSRKCGK